MVKLEDHICWIETKLVTIQIYRNQTSPTALSYLLFAKDNLTSPFRSCEYSISLRTEIKVKLTFNSQGRGLKLAYASINQSFIYPRIV